LHFLVSFARATAFNHKAPPAAEIQAAPLRDMEALNAPEKARLVFQP